MSGDLLTLTHDHDLPPKWDGRAVWWAGWEPQIDAFICGRRGSSRRTRVCEACGSTEKPVVNRGHVARTTATSLERWIERCEAWQRLPAGSRHLLPKNPSGYLELFAFRCTDCRTDVVWDMDTDEWWTLDHTDYGDNGSSDPARDA